MANVLCAEWAVWGALEPVRDVASTFEMNPPALAKTRPQTRRLRFCANNS